MKPIRSERAGGQRRRLATGIKRSLFDLQSRLATMNGQVSGRLSLKPVDLECLGAIFRDGPVSPGTLARRTGVHPATMTGILDRLQRTGWIIRERDPEAADRRAVAVRAVTRRTPELFALLAGMTQRMDRVCEEYTEDELRVVTDFLDRTALAAREAADELAVSGDARAR